MNGRWQKVSNVTYNHVNDKVVSYPEDWNKLVSDCPWGSFYQTVENLELLKAVTPAELYLISNYDSDRLVAGIPYAVQQGPLGPVVNSLSYFGSYADCLSSSLASKDAEEQIYRSLIEKCSAMDALCLNVITSPFADAAHHEKVKRILDPTFVDTRLCQITCLPEYDGEAREGYAQKVLSVMQPRARTVYRKSLKGGFEMRRCLTESEVLEFAEIHKSNIAAKGGIFKREDFFFKAFAMSKKDPGKVELIIMLDSGKIIAGVVLFYFNNTVEYHTTCLLDGYRPLGPLNRIIVEKMVDAGMTGYRYWNFGGTWENQEGVYRFKQSFSARDHRYYYYTVFFRDLDKIKAMSAKEVRKGYPFCFVIPFSELSK